MLTFDLPWFLISWAALAAGVLIGNWAAHHARSGEVREKGRGRHAHPDAERADPQARQLPPPPPAGQDSTAARADVPPTAAIPAQGKASVSARGEPVCRCTHDLLDHAVDPAVCFSCPCREFRAIPRLTGRQ